MAPIRFPPTPIACTPAENEVEREMERENFEAVVREKLKVIAVPDATKLSSTTIDDGDYDAEEIVAASLDTLLEKTITVFDDLVVKGEVLWQDSIPEVIDVGGGFKVQFRLTPALLPKPFSRDPFEQPQTPAPDSFPGISDSVSTKSQPPPKHRNPFLPPSPTEIVAALPPHHTLIVNKFSVLRPQLLLLTNTFERQDHDLRDVDINMSWRVLQALESNRNNAPGCRGEDDDINVGRFLAAYNCGLEAGCSQAHRHVQFVPIPPASSSSAAEAEFTLWPDQLPPTPTPTISTISIPFHYLHTSLLPSSSLYKTYTTLLTTARTRHPEMRGYNLMFTASWMVLVPRRLGEVDGVSTNAFGMLGMVWVKDVEERGRWGSCEDGGRGVRGVLAEMGIAK